MHHWLRENMLTQPKRAIFCNKQLIFWVEEESATEFTTPQNDEQTLCVVSNFIFYAKI